MTTRTQFGLFATRRFLPLFVTQFLGAFNDNVFKNAFIVMISFQGLRLAGTGLSPEALINAIAGVFILPYFLFSALAGQLAEKHDKAVLARWVKVLEIGIMAVACAGFVLPSAPLLFACLFLLGVHSTFFGPLKYSVLPQYLDDRELVGGNGMIEAGTFIAILLGQIAGALMIEKAPMGGWALGVGCLGIAVVGWLASRRMPPAPPTEPGLRVRWNLVAETWSLIAQAAGRRQVFAGLLGISWFWFFGSIYIVQLPELTRGTLGGGAELYTVLLVLFSVGLGVGSALCEKLSGRRMEPGLIVPGALGMSLAALGLQAALAFGSLPWVFVTVFLIGVTGGVYSVPLYAWIQMMSEPRVLSRTIAANNVLNAVGMVVAAVAGMLLLSWGISVPQLLLGAALLNLVVAALMLAWLPDYTLRFTTGALARLLYRVRCQGLEQIPARGPFVAVCNHVTFIDWLIVAGMIHRPVRFVIDRRFTRAPGLGWLFKMAGVIPIASRADDPVQTKRAFDRISWYLERGEAVCLFPEGAITRDGELQEFRRGIEAIIRRNPVPVLPVALTGLWGSYFSRKGGKAMSGLPRRLRPRVGLVIGAPIPPENVTCRGLEEQVGSLRGANQ